ncbi:sister chromatid cohesion 1 protein 3 [Cannabis sativa]|uniref:sister chromatid cohesion 1 protein 3 n=1 Tax=Cannabis sativa TaxID=3483 RepID=UPI0029CA595F|nr:sister chromatid cohesion 1 protein 3 [Cannabis sativa]
MFYSHTFLARKGPLGTVWFAAHLQNKLKKSHYISTDISSTVERIMFPEVPLALRMSGHLLLGIVRIYSKKVHYLHEDCTAIFTSLMKAFAPSSSLDLTLPDDKRHAPVQDVTLPIIFELDAMDLDFDVNLDGAFDQHLKSYEDITMTDYTNQIPMETVLFSLNLHEDMYDTSHPVENPPSNEKDMEDVVHPVQPDIGNDDEIPFNFTSHNVPDDVVQDPGSSHHAEIPVHSGDNSADVPLERMRDDVHDSPGIPTMFTSVTGDTPEPPAFVETKETDAIPPVTDDNLGLGGQVSPLQQSSGPRASVASLGEDLIGSVSYAMQPSPSAQKPKVRARKRKQLYDEAPVLTNKFMKKALEDPSNLLRKRRKIPSTVLGIWKLKVNLRKEQVFFESSITGLCSDLCNIFDKDYMSSKLQHLEVACPDSAAPSPGSAPDIFPEPGLPGSPAHIPTTATATDASPQNENAEFQTPINENIPEFEGSTHVTDHDNIIPSPRDVSPSETAKSTPFPEMETGRHEFPTPDFSVPSRRDESDLETLDEYTRDRTNLSTIPEPNTAEAEDLWFLEADNNTPEGSQGTQGIDSLSIRTRAMAQFLKRQSPTSTISEGLFGDLSLNKLLEGKTRRLCARMFSETLVLKSSGLVDVQQEVPYGDITIKLTAELSKAQI